MPAMPSPPRLRKRPLEANAATSAADEIDIADCAAIAYTSEDPAHPVEHMLDGCCGPGAPRWMSARPDTTEHIVIEFDRPQTISGLVYEVEETTRERTQEVRVEASEDGGQSYRQILVQEYNFSPGGATYQREEQHFNLRQVTHLRLTIVPNKSGSGTATLTALRLFG
jgi:F5/8 type C domain